jgi:threonine dehydrogenase-like Zn-dependent dehydrogenase
VAVEEVEDARIERPTDVLVKITSTNICGSDLDYVMLADIWPTGWRWSTRSAQS